MKRVALRIAVLLLLTGGLAYAWLAYSPRQAPEVEFTTLAGSTLRMSDLRGHPVLVTFWATSCVSCWKEMPDLVSLHQDYEGRGFRLIAVAMEYDPPERVAELATAKLLPYIVVHDERGRIAEGFDRVELIPASFLIAPDGRIVQRHTGPIPAGELRVTIERLLEES